MPQEVLAENIAIMLRSAVRGACLLLALVAACKASPVADEVEGNIK